MNPDNIREIASLLGGIRPTPIEVSVWSLLLDVGLLLVMTTILGLIYIRSSYSLSNRKRLAVLFPILALTTMMIISIIQVSLALSLGLVGALSIVRFRAAIKEPEELIYIFLVISLGLGFGAHQREVAITFYVIIVAVLSIKLIAQRRFRIFNPKTDKTMYVDLTFENHTIGNESDDLLDKSASVLEKHCEMIDLKRVDQFDKKLKLLFEVKLNDLPSLNKLRNNLAKIEQSPDITILQHEDLYG